MCNKDCFSSQEKASFFVTKVDVVDRFVCADCLPGPRLTAVIRPTQISGITTNPTTFTIEKIDGVEILSLNSDIRWHPG